MNALDRFAHFKKRFRKKLGTAQLSAEAARHLAHAAEIEQVIEMCKHEMMAGKKFDPADIAGLRAEIPLAIMRLTIAAGM